MIEAHDGAVPLRVAAWLKTEAGFSVEQMGRRWVLKQTYPEGGYATWVIGWDGEKPTIGGALSVLAAEA